mmetsp:Transcript_85809/g.276990  ORF Transcript_85809/g.276990 Transcript_85809/m.276990 type:complete len:316 (-) Transcript_85809:173-1120(-)
MGPKQLGQGRGGCGLHPESDRRQGTRRPAPHVVRSLGPRPHQGHHGAEAAVAREHQGVAGYDHEGALAAQGRGAPGPCDAGEDLALRGRVLLRAGPHGGGGVHRQGSPHQQPERPLQERRSQGALPEGPEVLQGVAQAVQDHGRRPQPADRHGVPGRGLGPAEAGQGGGGQGLPLGRCGGALEAAKWLGRRQPPRCRGAGAGPGHADGGPHLGCPSAKCRPGGFGEILQGLGQVVRQRLWAPPALEGESGRVSLREARLFMLYDYGGFKCGAGHGEEPGAAPEVPLAEPGHAAGPALQRAAALAAEWRRRLRARR